MAANVQYRPLGSLIQLIQYERQGVPEVLIQNLLMEAAQELAVSCIGTLDVEMMGQSKVRRYDFSHCLPEDMEAVGVSQVIVCGECLETQEKCKPCSRGYLLVNGTCIDIYPCPPKEKFQICLALQPTAACNQLPECFARHRRFLHHYVSGHLALMDSQEWGNPREAQFLIRKADGLKKAIAAREARHNKISGHNNNRAGCII